jgi:hypothetical protein
LRSAFAIQGYQLFPEEALFVRTTIAAVAAIALAPSALACSCLCDFPSLGAKEWLGKADYVFRGTVISTSGDDLNERCQQPSAKCSDDVIENGRTAKLKVTKLLKGKPADVLTVYSAISPSMCGVGFEPGQTTNLLAFRQKDGKLHVSGCSQSCGSRAGAFNGLEGNK